MYSFSKSSERELNTADEALQRVFREVIKHWDCAVLKGHRGQVEQDECCEKGMSKVKWPNSKHNSMPSKALDVAPYPVDWNDTKRFVLFGGFVLGIAASLGIKLRWGGDFNMNGTPSDESFLDLPHFELVE